MRIKENPFELDYLRTLEVLFFRLFNQDKKHESEQVFWNYLDDLTDIIDRLKDIQKRPFLSQLVNELDEEMFFIGKEYTEFQLYFKPYRARYEDFVRSIVLDKVKQVAGSKPKFTMKQIALIQYYEGNTITRANADKIAAEYGFIAPNSGEKLFQNFTSFSSTGNRKARPNPFTQLKLKNKIKMFESIVIHLSDAKKQQALDEISVLKSYLENDE